MKARMFEILAKLDARLLTGLMALIVCLLALEGWLLVLRAPLAEYRKLAAAEHTLASTLAASPDHQGELGRLAAELRQVTARITGALRPPATEEQTAALVMAELDRSAGQHGIALTGIRPGPRREVLSFEETSFEVNAKGDYVRLCRWLLEFERTLGQSATVSEFTMKAADEGRVIALTLNVGLYRPLQLASAVR